MAGQVEDMHDAFPYRLAVECLANGDCLGQRRGAAMHTFDGFAELIGFRHSNRHTVTAVAAIFACLASICRLAHPLCPAISRVVCNSLPA